MLAHRIRPPLGGSWNGKVRFALLTVNYNTTHYLKLMMATLLDQERIDLVSQVVIVDQDSRDGATGFLERINDDCARVTVVKRKRWLHHAPGMRNAISALDRAERSIDAANRATVLLHIDPDVIFLDPTALGTLEVCFDNPEVAFVGELRHHLFPLPEAQASFLAVRRDWAARKDISPWVHHGSPAWWLQRDCWRAGARGADFRNNQEGYALHRGRTAVASAGEYSPWSAYASVRRRDAHFMGVEGGRNTWHATERRYAEWLEPGNEGMLVSRLAEVFS